MQGKMGGVENENGNGYWRDQISNGVGIWDELYRIDSVGSHGKYIASAQERIAD
jgi:hypothetical protein